MGLIEKQLELVVKQLEEMKLRQEKHKKKEKELDVLKRDIGWIKRKINGDEDGKEEMEEEKLRKWLEDIVRLPQYYEILVDQGFEDLESMKDITMDNLKEIGIDKLGHRSKIFKYAQQLNDV